MSDKLLNTKIRPTQKDARGGVWVNAETKTHALSYAKIGAGIGLFLGVVGSVILRLTLNFPENIFFVLYVLPFFAMFFVASAGLLIGIGTPTEKLNPEQGRLIPWSRFFKK